MKISRSLTRSAKRVRGSKRGERADFPVVKPDVLVRDALSGMEEADVDLVPVLDGVTFVGIVTTTEIPKLDEILGQTSGDT